MDLRSYAESVPQILDRLAAALALSEQWCVLVKPNLINASPPPITTPVACCEAIVEYVKTHSKARLLIGEGCGDPDMETQDVFEALSYTEMAARQGVELVDLNHADLERLENPECPVFPEMYLPSVALKAFLISVPVLKAHSLADVTGSLKNMIGLAPPEHYSGRYGTWKKAVFHGDMQQAIVDLNTYRTPDLTLMDAAVGMPDFHLGGRHCDPPSTSYSAALMRGKSTGKPPASSAATGRKSPTCADKPHQVHANQSVTFPHGHPGDLKPSILVPTSRC